MNGGDGVLHTRADFVDEAAINKLACGVFGFPMVEIAKPQRYLLIRACRASALSLFLDADLCADSVKIERVLGSRVRDNRCLLRIALSFFVQLSRHGGFPSIGLQI